MIVLSASAPRSGSRWYFQKTYELLRKADQADMFDLRDKYSLNFLSEGGYIIRPFNWHKLARLALISAIEGSFIVKTHREPTRAIRTLMRLGIMKTTYIYRDPRNRLLSVLEQGKRSREQGGGMFARIETLDDAIQFVKRGNRGWQMWHEVPDVLFVRYEDLIGDPLKAMMKTVDYLKLPVNEAQVSEIIERTDTKYRGQNIGFHKGGDRFKEYFSEEEQDYINQTLEQEILTFGYALSK